MAMETLKWTAFDDMDLACVSSDTLLCYKEAVCFSPAIGPRGFSITSPQDGFPSTKVFRTFL